MATRKDLTEAVTKYYESLGFKVEDINIQEDTQTAHVEVTVKARAPVFALNIPCHVSVGHQVQSVPRSNRMVPGPVQSFIGFDYADLEPRAFAMEFGCDHDYQEKFLFSSSYHKCTKCGDEK